MSNLSYNKFEVQAQGKKALIDQLFTEECNKIYDRVLRVSDAFYNDLENNIPRWINEAKCSNNISNIFKVKSQAEAFTSELVTISSDKIKTKTEEWVENHFIPVLKSEIKTLTQTMDSHTNTYMNELSNLRVSLNIDQQNIVKNTTPSKANRALSAGASLLVGDLGGAIMGGAGGFDATLKTLGCEAGAGVILGIISLFTPVGLTAFVVGAVLSVLVGSNWSLNSMESKIRKEVSKNMVENIKSESNKERFKMMIISNVDKSLSELRRNINTRWNGLLIA